MSVSSKALRPRKASKTATTRTIAIIIIIIIKVVGKSSIHSNLCTPVSFNRCGGIKWQRQCPNNGSKRPSNWLRDSPAPPHCSHRSWAPTSQNAVCYVYFNVALRPQRPSDDKGTVLKASAIPNVKICGFKNVCFEALFCFCFCLLNRLFKVLHFFIFSYKENCLIIINKVFVKRKFVFLDLRIHTQTHTHTHAHARTHTHTHTHTHTQAPAHTSILTIQS